jgi:hypothetical protein
MTEEKLPAGPYKCCQIGRRVFRFSWKLSTLRRSVCVVRRQRVELSGGVRFKVQGSCEHCDKQSGSTKDGVLTAAAKRITTSDEGSNWGI